MLSQKNKAFYTKADAYFGVNIDDTILKSIYISLPKSPSLNLIDGYGEHRLLQKFKRLAPPERLILLEKRVHQELKEWSNVRISNTITGYRIVEKYWEILKEEQDEYKDEIKYIKKVIWYSIHGYWCFIKGKPTYLPPWYFCYLNFWKMPYLEGKEKYPEYRDEDRKLSLFKHYLWTTKETFKNKDKDGNAIRNHLGEYEMIEMVNRTFYGIMNLKRRRGGYSNMALSNISCIARIGLSKSCPIIADTGEHAKGHWDKRMIPAWQSLPLFLKPIWDGSNSPNRIHYTAPSNIYGKKTLDSVIYYLGTGGEGAVDSDRIDGVLLDESGKLIRVDASQRWGITKLTLAQGAMVHGWAEVPSTVEDMTEGGEEFYSLWRDSDFYCRKINGQTKSGLARGFRGSHIVYDLFIDNWGKSVVESPTKEQIEYAPKNSLIKQGLGAREYHLSNRKHLLKSKSPKDKYEYKKMIRREPMFSHECWLGVGGDIGFPNEEIEKRLSILRINNYKDVAVGDFVWRGGVKDSIVDFVENDKGKFLVSLLLDREDTYKSNLFNKMMKWNSRERKQIEVFAPLHKDIFTVGIDTITNLSTNEPGAVYQSKLSDCGIAVYWHFDKVLDKDKTTDNCLSRRFVCTYRNRPEFSDLVEDVIKVSRYYGGMMYFERNKEELINRIEDRGYSGYFKYKYNIKTKMYDPLPGEYANAANIDEMLLGMREHLQLRCHAEMHHDLLQEANEITSRNKLGRKDLLAAAGWARRGADSNYGVLLDDLDNNNDDDDIDLSGTFLGQRKY